MLVRPQLAVNIGMCARAMANFGLDDLRLVNPREGWPRVGEYRDIAYAAAATLSGLSAAIGYYGGAIVRFADDKPKVPTQLHFGEKDAGIPLSDVETIKAKRPEVEVFVYPGAQHGFHCDERASYDKTSADIAWPRSMTFFAKHLKK